MNDSESSVTSATCSSLPWISSCWVTLQGWSTFLYVLQELIKLLHGFVNHMRSNVRNHLDTPPWSDHPNEVVYEKEVTWSLWLWTWWSCQLLVGFMDSKSSHVNFVTSLPIQPAYGSNSQDLFQKFDLTTHKIPLNFGETLGQSPFLSRSISNQVQSQSLRHRPGYSHTVWDSKRLILWWLSSFILNWYCDFSFIHIYLFVYIYDIYDIHCCLPTVATPSEIYYCHPINRLPSVLSIATLFDLTVYCVCVCVCVCVYVCVCVCA